MGPREESRAQLLLWSEGSLENRVRMHVRVCVFICVFM